MPQTPTDFMQAMFCRETSLVAGEVELHVSPNLRASDDEHHFLGTGVDLRIRWNSPYVFRIDVIRNGAIERTLKSDGEYVCTGKEALWRIQYFTNIGYSDDAFIEMLVGELWPYEIFRRHIYPLSHGQMLTVSFVYLNGLEIDLQEVKQSDYDRPVIRVQQHYSEDEKRPWFFHVDETRDHLITNYTEFPDCPDISHSMVYAEPFQTQSGVWLMKTARHIHANEAAGGLDWISTINTETHTPTIQSTDAFQIFDKGLDRIRRAGRANARSRRRNGRPFSIARSLRGLVRSLGLPWNR